MARNEIDLTHFFTCKTDDLLALKSEQVDDLFHPALSVKD
jgi:hypothetical protein